MERSQTERWIEIPFGPSSHHTLPNPFGVQRASVLTCEGENGGSSPGTSALVLQQPTPWTEKQLIPAKKKLFCWYELNQFTEQITL